MFNKQNCSKDSASKQKKTVPAFFSQVAKGFVVFVVCLVMTLDNMVYQVKNQLEDKTDGSAASAILYGVLCAVLPFCDALNQYLVKLAEKKKLDFSGSLLVKEVDRKHLFTHQTKPCHRHRIRHSRYKKYVVKTQSDNKKQE